MAFAKLLGPKTPWDSTDVANLRQWLATVSGQRFLAKSFSMRPRATERTDPVKRAIQSGVQEGYEEFFHIAIALTTARSASDSPKLTT